MRVSAGVYLLIFCFHLLMCGYLFADDDIFIVLAKIDHILFKMNAYKSIEYGKKTINFTDHNDCRFGKWYNGEGKKVFGNTKVFNSIDKEHTIVHDKVLDAMSFIKDDYNIDPTKYGVIYDNFEIMEKASDALFKLLDNMNNERIELENKKENSN